MEIRNKSRTLVLSPCSLGSLGVKHHNLWGSEGCPLLLVTKPQWGPLQWQCPESGNGDHQDGSYP